MVLGKTFERENFHELVEKNFVEKTFADCLLVPPKDAMPPNFAEKAFNSKFAIHVVSHYMVCYSFLTMIVRTLVYKPPTFISRQLPYTLTVMDLLT